MYWYLHVADEDNDDMGHESAHDGQKSADSNVISGQLMRKKYVKTWLSCNLCMLNLYMLNNIHIDEYICHT